MFSVKGGGYILEVYIINFKIIGYIICPRFNDTFQSNYLILIFIINVNVKIYG